MANLKHNTRWVLDTAESVVSAGTFIRIIGLHYVGTTNEHECILHDGNGKEIWKAKLGTVATSGYNATLPIPNQGILVDGLDLDTINSGVLYVYLGKQ